MVEAAEPLLEPVDPLQRIRRVQRVRRPLEHQLEAVDAGQLVVDHARRLTQRMRVGEEIDVVRVDFQPQDPQGRDGAQRERLVHRHGREPVAADAGALLFDRFGDDETQRRNMRGPKTTPRPTMQHQPWGLFCQIDCGSLAWYF